jgi:hypothetical protein
MATLISEKHEIKAVDRCDACSAAARIIVKFESGELFFCGHHARKSKEKLEETALSIYDPDKELSLGL